MRTSYVLALALTLHGAFSVAHAQGPDATAPKPGSVPPAATAAPQSVEADIAFWNSIKDQKSAAQFQAYLNRFPNGTFAELARIRLQELQAQGSALVREVQQRLYDLNYPVLRTDGSIDQSTQSAIRLWQRRYGHTPTGRLTAEQVRQLRALKPSPSWAAIAYATGGRAFAVSGQASRRQSESRALAECLQATGSACNVKAVPANACLALGFGSRPEGANTRSIFAFGAGPTADAAKARALASCTAQGYTNCTAPAEVCARIGDAPNPSSSGPPAAGAAPPATSQPPQRPRPPPSKKTSDQDA